MINLILIKNGNPENKANQKIFISCPIQFDTDLSIHLARAGWEDWDEFLFEVGQDTNSIRNGYGVIYFRVKKNQFRQIVLTVEGEKGVARLGTRIFYSMFVHASGTIAITKHVLDTEKKVMRAVTLRPRAYFNNLTDATVSLRQLQKEKVNLPTPVLAELARRIVHLGNLITARAPVLRETVTEEEDGRVVNFQEAAKELARRAGNET